jgi:hypothetical protein
MAIGGYSIVDINGYSRLYYDYWWVLYYKFSFVILCYITTIGGYYIINFCWLFYVILRLLMGIIL